MKVKTPRVGLLMSTYNQGEQLAKTIKSLLSQNYPNFQLTIINDASQDNTREILASIEDPRLNIVHHQHKQGLIPSLNIAYKKSKPCAYYGVVYAACFYAPYYLKDLMSSLINHPKSVGAYALAMDPGTRAQFREVRYANTELLQRNALGRGIIFRAQPFQAMGGTFLSQAKGLRETWLRIAQKGDFKQVSKLLYHYAYTPYENPGSAYQIDWDKDIHPYFKLKILSLEDDRLDPTLKRILNTSGHQIKKAFKSDESPELILLNSPSQFEQAERLSYQHFCPMLYVSQEAADLTYLQQELPRSLESLHFASSEPEFIKALKERHRLPTLGYHADHNSRSFNRALGKLPGLLNRSKTALVIRSYGHPEYVRATLEWLNTLNRPFQWGSIIVLGVGDYPQNEMLAKQAGVAYYRVKAKQYFPELHFLLQQLSVSYVMHIDAGVLPAVNWFTEALSFASHPQTGMVSSYLQNSPFNHQHLPFRANTLKQVEHEWRKLRERAKKQPPRAYTHLSDSLMLSSHHKFLRALEHGKDIYPMGYEGCFSVIFKSMGLLNLMNYNTAGFMTI